MIDIIICGMICADTALLVMIYLLLCRIYPLLRQNPPYFYSKSRDSGTKMRVISPFIDRDAVKKGGDKV